MHIRKQTWRAVVSAAALCAAAVLPLGANAATQLTLNDGDTLQGVYEDYEITIAAGATVTFDGASLTNTTCNAPAVKCLGNATIVLAEGSDNSVVNMVDYYSAIYPAADATLTIQGSGSLYVAAPGKYFKNYGAAIGSYSGGGSNTGTPCGNIVISGGNITAVGGYCGAGVGACSYDAACGDITITGDAVVHATGGAWAAGIGAASDRSPCGNITISGNASVTATSTAYSGANSAGIGAGYDSACGNITVSTTGTVEAQGFNAAGIGAGGTMPATCAGITITGGNITATGGSDACAIGATFNAGCGDILIEGGTITATGGEDCPGVGTRGETASITITGGNVTAIGGSNGSRKNGGAGIGSMYDRTCGNITISGGTVNATGGAWAAGIGSGYYGTCSNITISAGIVTANVCTSTGDSETDTVAIGAGCYGTCGNILISGGTVIADATNPQSTTYDYNSAIGATYRGTCGDITITDGITSVTATKGATAQQHIGQGNGTVTIGTITYGSHLKQTLSNGDLTVTVEPQTFTVTWKDDDGSTIDTGTVAYGQTPSHADPTKAATAQYTYTFAGWTPAVVAVESNTTYTATYDATVREYTITWLDDEDQVVTTDSVPYGSTPICAAPTKASTAQYDYEFAGWEPAIVPVAGEATYKATYTPTLRSYTVTWQDNDGTTLGTDTLTYGSTPSRANPTKAADAQYTYTFTGWSPAIATVTGDATYTATYSQTVNIYTITWLDYDGSTIKTETLAYGATPTCATPSRADDTYNTYTFLGWSPVVATVTGPATYTAMYMAHSKWTGQGTDVEPYTLTTPARISEIITLDEGSSSEIYVNVGGDITTESITANLPTGYAVRKTGTAGVVKVVQILEVVWYDDDGTELRRDEVDAGDMPSYGLTPTKASTAQYDYTFAGWTPEIVTVTESASYTATYTETLRSYTITWLDADGSVLDATSVEYGGTPTRAAPASVYTFTGWSPTITSVVSNATYTATFSQTVNLANLTGAYTAAHGDVLTGTTTHNVSIPGGAKVTINGVSVTGAGGGVTPAAPSFSEGGETATTKFVKGTDGKWRIVAFAELATGTAAGVDGMITILRGDEPNAVVTPVAPDTLCTTNAVKVEAVVTPPAGKDKQFFKVKFGE